MMASDSTVTKEWICAPGKTVTSGPIVTPFDIRIGTTSFGVGGSEVGVLGGMPIVLFSLMMQPSPMMTGPS